MSRKNSKQIESDIPLFDTIPEYDQIIADLSRGQLKADFSLIARKSKLSNSLQDILFDQTNDELSYFVLFMDSLDMSNYVKFILDLKNFESAVINMELISLSAKQCQHIYTHNQLIAQDALTIFSKYITQEALNSIHLPSQIIDTIIHNICPENQDVKIDLDCFGPGKDYVYELLENEFYEKYLVSEYHCKYILSSLESRTIKLSDLVYDDIAVVYFLEYLEQENKSALLKFWIQAENFSRNILNFSKKKEPNFSMAALYSQWQSDAIIIYDNFVSLQAKNKLGFDQFARQSVESNICYQNLESSDIDSFIQSYADSFYVPMLIVFNILDRVYCQKFIESTLFIKLINEIKNSSKINSKLSPNQSKVETKSEIKQITPLWARPQSGSLQFGKVDATGRYIAFDGSVNVRSDQTKTKRIFNDITNEYDDDWSLGNQDESVEKSKTSILEKKIKMKLEKFINLMPLNGLTSNYSKTSTEDLEIAEKMADLLVKEVERDNQLV